MKKLVVFFWIGFLNFSVVHAQLAAVFMEQGHAYAQKGNYKKALKCYNKVIAEDANHIEAYYHRGQIHYELRHYNAAIADSREALRINPAYQNAYFNLGIAYFGLEEYAACIENFTTAIELKAQDAESLYWRGRAYLQVNKKKEACKDWQEAQKLGHGMATPLIHKHCEEENAVDTGDK